MTELSSRDYYCSIKFRHLKVDLESSTTYNCHASAPHPIDYKWLESNPGQIFNTDINVSERQMMLANKRNPSCEQNCWPAEDRGAVSPRLYQGGVSKTHFNIRPTPEIVDITINSDCNLTCSYCCKEFSSAWRNDIAKNGPYPLIQDISRYSLDNKDKTLMKVKQTELKHSARYNKILHEIKSVALGIKKLEVTGGEPFLDNQLADTIISMNLPDSAEINIYTGLGVDNTRLQKLCSKLSTIPNVKLKISAENIGKNLEFNRYGVKWEDFCRNIETIREYNIDFSFHCTISNLTIFGFQEFYNHFADQRITISFAHQPSMMAPYVLDSDSKELLTKQFDCLPDKYKTPLIKSIQGIPSTIEQQDLTKFLVEFVRRRPKLDTRIFPETFLKWVGISNVV